VENYPLPMLDYVAVVHFSEAGQGKTQIRWEGHYTEGALPAAQMDPLLQDFYGLFMGNIEKAYALGKQAGETPY
jgi:hypothetical protein